MAKAAAKTTIGPIALVAVEQYYPEGERVINDDLAYHMLPAWSKVFVHLLKPRWVREWMIGRSEKSQPGIWGGLLCRKRYIDDQLKSSAKNFEQVVNLGAGFDTRNFRLPFLSSKPVWEIDQPENSEAKETCLQNALGKIPSNVRLVLMDFDRDDLDTILLSQRYSLAMQTFFIMEAVTQYLTERGIEKIFDFLAKVASGSRLIFSYVRKDFLDGRSIYGWESVYDKSQVLF